MTEHHGFAWPQGQRCAVSLTYDDALPVHHEMVAPLLAEKGLSATLNVYAHSGFTEDTSNWRRVASLGHELGNHTLFHPCRREPEERYSWLAPHYDLCHYTAQRWLDEMRIANCLLGMIDGRSVRTFGNTCCNTTIGRGEHVVNLADLITRLFIAGRGACDGSIVLPASLCYGELGHCNGDGRTCVDIRQDIETAMDQGGWIILMFHGVGKGTHGGFIETGEHAKLVDYLAKESDQIWTSSMVNVATYLKQSGYVTKPEKRDAGNPALRDT